MSDIQEEIYDTIRERICLLDYPPANHLSEGELAAEFGVSRTPIREVLKRLAFEGLLESRNGVGTIVRRFTFAELHDAYEMRLKSAELIGQLSPRNIGKRHREKLDKLLLRAEEIKEMAANASKAPSSSPLPREHARTNHELHRLIASLIGNDALRQVFDLLYFQTACLWYGHINDIWEEEADALVAEIRELQRAFLINDPVAVGYIKRNYIAQSMARISRLEG